MQKDVGDNVGYFIFPPIDEQLKHICKCEYHSYLILESAKIRIKEISMGSPVSTIKGKQSLKSNYHLKGKFKI